VEAGAMTAVTYDELVDLSGGKFGKIDVACPLCGPYRKKHNQKSKTLAIWRKEDGFATYHCAHCEAKGYAFESNGVVKSKDELEAIHERIRTDRERDQREREERTESARQIWAATVPLAGTLGHKYLTEIRGLDVDRLELGHVLRWHERGRMLVAMMTDARSGRPTGVHRTYLDDAGSKLRRKMLGTMGVIRISPDEDVTLGLGIVEGIEKALAILLHGWAPIWCGTCAGGISGFPVLSGIESLTIFKDDDSAGKEAAAKCARVWHATGREVFIK
jgi:hypothetical protein